MKMRMDVEKNVICLFVCLLACLLVWNENENENDDGVEIIVLDGNSVSLVRMNWLFVKNRN